ncbi:hypothetical protein FQA39_LY16191 [Lamprigera yunnana]|nr:hypothetical protein FQA39_LY16191 [Lamprigera yunnana]
MSEKPKSDLGLLEEDDEFEEFPVEGKFYEKNSPNKPLLVDWTSKDKDEQDISVWEDNWEDDNVEDDFNKQLRFKDLSKKSRYKLAAMKNSKWASFLQSLVETDIGISYEDTSFINYDVPLSKDKMLFPSVPTKGLSRTWSFIEHSVSPIKKKMNLS